MQNRYEPQHPNGKRTNQADENRTQWRPEAQGSQDFQPSFDARNDRDRDRDNGANNASRHDGYSMQQRRPAAFGQDYDQQQSEQWATEGTQYGAGQGTYEQRTQYGQKN